MVLTTFDGALRLPKSKFVVVNAAASGPSIVALRMERPASERPLIASNREYRWLSRIPLPKF